MVTGLHIFNRDSIYYWRKRLPAGMRGAFQKREIVLSLRTSDIKRARRMARRLTVQFEEFQHFMALIHRSPTHDEARQVLAALYNEILLECRAQAARTYHPDELPDDWAEKSVRTEADDADYAVWYAAHAEYMAPELAIEQLRENIATNRYRGIRSQLGPHLAAREIDAATDSHEFRLFLRQAQQMALKAFQDALDEASGTRLPVQVSDLAVEPRSPVQPPIAPAPAIEERAIAGQMQRGYSSLVRRQRL